MQEKRKYERHPDTLKMSVKQSTGGAGIYVTRDVSDGGLFLLATTGEQLPVGTEVIISPVRNAVGITPPAIKGRVVRSSAQGIGIEFIEPSFS
ncbi:MAG: PilZ domain-containing protein [Sulfuricaulis sp.]